LDLRAEQLLDHVRRRQRRAIDALEDFALVCTRYGRHVRGVKLQ
jgi:hypothetical protein